MRFAGIELLHFYTLLGPTFTLVAHFLSAAPRAHIPVPCPHDTHAAELKEELEARGEGKTGNKAWLRRRLHAAILHNYLEAADKGT